MKNTINEMSLADLYIVHKFLKRKLKDNPISEIHYDSNISGEFELLNVIEKRIDSFVKKGNIELKK